MSGSSVRIPPPGGANVLMQLQNPDLIESWAVVPRRPHSLGARRFEPDQEVPLMPQQRARRQTRPTLSPLLPES